LRPESCLKLDVTYAATCLLIFIYLIDSDSVSASSVLILLAAAGIATVGPWLNATVITLNASFADTKAAVKEIWPHASWALPGTIVSWAFANGYVLIAAIIVGPSATADIVAARLFVAPLGVAYLAWSNVFRPRASHWLAAGRYSTVIKVSYAALIGLVVAVAVYASVLVMAYPTLENFILGSKYKGLTIDIAWWGGFFLASGIAGIGTGVLTALGKIKATFLAAFAGCVVSIPLMFVLGGTLGKNGILLGLTVGECITALWLLLAMRRGLLALHIKEEK
jgi:O-antigen/teichoic acid export membrane protein